ncbi:diguanylate phosphodiesterase [Endozoicomonas montiporae]|uniref:Diguanylate phosphodiesterase n=2 Tax=Endozoicomonas montiporae TaxID=1027273 RepID=A0A081N7H3_9GAMM|nr:glutathione ABC transporter substrate-binding protein [Endozoicomonas montiporae]AMO55763.1 dipeptide ABC transporter extracellular solute-binding protein [Endozoicomonas montiporae CL-33]KEQ14396.1 diguanylate phosphodiesterase [Endozoicomonas montiporae]
MRKLKVAIASCAAVLLAACSSPQDTAGIRDTVVVAQRSDAKTLDPHATNDQPSSRVAVQIYSQLVETDSNMEIVPGLAESWEQVDDKTLKLHLRKGVKFHNGEELKASDVKFTLDRMIASPTVAHIVGAIESVSVIDEYTVTVKTSEPFGPLLYHLSHTAASILNEKAVTEAGDSYGQNPIGTGPYEFVSWSVGDSVTLKAFDDYYGGKQEVPNAIFRNISEGTNRAIALETGEVDIAYDIEPIDKDTIHNHKQLKLIEGESLSITYFGFNVNRAPYDNVKVRQAMAYAMNTQDIIDAVVMGGGLPTNSPISSRVFGHNPEAKQYEQNYDKARQLLKEAGYENGFETTLWVSDNPVRIQIAQVIQAQLREVGIHMAIDVVEWGAFLDGTSRGDHETFMMGWVTVTGDADYGLYALFNSATHGGAGNRSFYSNDDIDSMLQAARVSSDMAERSKLYGDIQLTLQEELPTISIFNEFQNAGMQSNVKGFELAPPGHHKLRGVRFEG